MTRFLRFACVMAFVLFAPGTLGAQAVNANRVELSNLRRQIDSLKTLVDSLRKPSKPLPLAATSAGGPIVFSARKWSVNRSIDKMTDAPSCTGLYENEWKVQMSRSGFYVSYRGRGGVSGITVRFGDEPARPLRLATSMEKSVSAVILKDDDLVAVLAAPRLRVQVMTVLDRLLVDDIDLAGAKEAYEFISTDPRCQGGS